jgi:hypothetical protein
MIKNPQVGDIVRVRSTDRNNLAVLFDTTNRKYVQGLLLHTAPELATDMDVVLAQGTVTPYPLVLCCDLYGAFLRSQIDRHIAHIDGFPVGHPLFNPAKVAKALGGYRGLPIFRGTERWTEKERLLEEELHPLIRPFWHGFRW